ncbi:hypothetical protein [Actinoplanes sp. HUAS TT8]
MSRRPLTLLTALAVLLLAVSACGRPVHRATPPPPSTAFTVIAR